MEGNRGALPLVRPDSPTMTATVMTMMSMSMMMMMITLMRLIYRFAKIDHHK